VTVVGGSYSALVPQLQMQLRQQNLPNLLTECPQNDNRMFARAKSSKPGGNIRLANKWSSLEPIFAG
jgi:hypothetical protein